MTNVMDDFEQFISDDMSVLHDLMHQIKGLNVVSTAPLLNDVVDDRPYSEEFEFERS